MKKLLVVVGTRPNFVKVTRFKEVAAIHGRVRIRSVHTGQQTDARMTEVFMEQFGFVPDHRLNIPSGTQLSQLAQVVNGLDALFTEERPDGVMVVGDVTSTLGGALAANKAGLPLFHLESGLRSGDRTMPEEMNRRLTDRLADHLFITEPSAAENLGKEGIDRVGIHFVGNTMIDTLVRFDARIRSDDVLQRMGWGEGGHVLLTMHRPATVDHPGRSAQAMDLIAAIASRRRTILPLHPRTEHHLARHGLLGRMGTIPGLIIAPPLDYFAFQRVLATSSVVITDSGGVQEECTFRGVPCLTLRDSTERPITITEGTNELVPLDVAVIHDRLDRIFGGDHKKGRVPELWDGHATERVMDVLERVL
jgi:UDP-N-acetylglucosamine 2-epimerase (non-hydrolysing)